MKVDFESPDQPLLESFNTILPLENLDELTTSDGRLGRTR